MKVLPMRFEYKLLSLCLFLFLIKLHVFIQAFIFLNKFSYESYLKIMFNDILNRENVQKYRKKKRIIKASLIYLNKSIILNLKILSTKNYNSINNFFAYKCYELLLSKGINILSLKMLTILIYIYVHSLCQIWHVFAIISSKISCPFLSLLLGIAL